jgi:hypothetical protein
VVKGADNVKEQQPDSVERGRTGCNEPNDITLRNERAEFAFSPSGSSREMARQIQ